MGTIETYYNRELAKEKQNNLLLQQLSKILERKTLTLKEWRLTGKFIPKADFAFENPTVELLATCSEVIKVLDDIEDEVWKEIAERLWCSEC